MPRREIARGKALGLHGLGDDFLGARPNLGWAVLHPSRLRINLLVFFLGWSNHFSIAAEGDEARAGCALIDGADVVRHWRVALRVKQFESEGRFYALAASFASPIF
jgi:hypothetical protein